MRTPQQIQGVLREVQRRLDAKPGTSSLALSVPPDGYLEDDDWLNVIVSATAPGVRAHQYVEALGEVEQELRADGIDRVLLVPALAD